MSRSKGIVYINNSQYFLRGAEVYDDVSAFPYTGSNGLLIALDAPGVPAVPGHVAIVFTGTGTDFGDVTVSVEVLDAEPAPQPEAWDDIAEASLRFEHSGFVTTVNETDEDDPLPDLPAGDVRVHVRVRVRGRDTAAEDRVGEEHLLQVWPAPPSPGLLLKATDDTGRELRSRPHPGPAT